MVDREKEEKFPWFSQYTGMIVKQSELDVKKSAYEARRQRSREVYRISLETLKAMSEVGKRELDGQISVKKGDEMISLGINDLIRIILRGRC